MKVGAQTEMMSIGERVMITRDELLTSTWRDPDIGRDEGTSGISDLNEYEEIYSRRSVQLSTRFLPRVEQPDAT